MQSHANHRTQGVTNPYIVAAAQKLAASQRAAKGSKKRIKGVAQVHSYIIPDRDLMMGRWMGQRNTPAL